MGSTPTFITSSLRQRLRTYGAIGRHSRISSRASSSSRQRRPRAVQKRENPQMIAHSPLRYPGVKQVLGRLAAHLIRINGAASVTYVYPYAGGAGTARGLLFCAHVDLDLIN